MRQCTGKNLTVDAVTGRTGYQWMIRTTTQLRRILKWLLLAMLAALVAYVVFRSYLNPEMLLNFANSFYC